MSAESVTQTGIHPRVDFFTKIVSSNLDHNMQAQVRTDAEIFAILKRLPHTLHLVTPETDIEILAYRAQDEKGVIVHAFDFKNGKFLHRESFCSKKDARKVFGHKIDPV